MNHTSHLLSLKEGNRVKCYALHNLPINIASPNIFMLSCPKFRVGTLSSPAKALLNTGKGVSEPECTMMP